MHCYNGYKYHKSTGSNQNIGLEFFEEVAKNISPNVVSFVHFLGGEPFSCPHLFQVTRALTSKGLNVGVNTNGTFLHKYSRQISDSGFNQIVVSLESPDEKIHNSIRRKKIFAKVIDGIASLDGFNGKMVLSWTLTKASIKNKNEAINMMKLCQNLKIHTLIVNWLFNDGYTMDNHDSLFYSTQDAIVFVEQLVEIWGQNSSTKLQIDARPKFIDYLNKKYNSKIPISAEMAICKGAKTHYMLRSNGELFPCAPFDGQYGKDFQNRRQFEFRPPSLAERSLSEIIRSDVFLKWKEETSPVISKASAKFCVDCKYRNICEPCPLIFNNEIAEECKYLSAQQ